MDFLEGFLLGPVWSETEYGTRRHIGFLWLIGWVFLAIFAFFVIFPASIPFFLRLPIFIPILLFCVLVLASPFLCHLYYRLNIFLKIGILLAQIFKYFLGMLILLQICQTVLIIDTAAAPLFFLNYVNDSVSAATGYFASLGKGTDILVGILAGGIWVVVVFGLGLLVLTVVPAIYMVMLKLIQRLVDRLIRTVVFKETKIQAS